MTYRLTWCILQQEAPHTLHESIGYQFLAKIIAYGYRGEIDRSFNKRIHQYIELKLLFLLFGSFCSTYHSQTINIDISIEVTRCESKFEMY